MTDSPLLRRRCRTALQHHRQRAARDKQQVEYTAQDLIDLAARIQRCTYCAAVLTPANFSFDHLMPTCRTADYSFANVWPCCRRCNEHKGLLSASEFRALLALVNDWSPLSRSDLLARLRAGGRRRRGEG